MYLNNKWSMLPEEDVKNTPFFSFKKTYLCLYMEPHHLFNVL